MSHFLEWRCPDCRKPSLQELDDERRLVCEHCGHARPYAEGSLDGSGQLADPVPHCIACGYSRMFSQKDFNKKLGIAVVVVGAALSPWTYGASLLACMALDYGLYYVVPEITVCYGCDAIHRGFEHNPRHRAHDPLLADRYRRQAVEEGRVPADEEEAA